MFGVFFSPFLALFKFSVVILKNNLNIKSKE